LDASWTVQMELLLDCAQFEKIGAKMQNVHQVKVLQII
jgi:hypothetical protein